MYSGPRPLLVAITVVVVLAPVTAATAALAIQDLRSIDTNQTAIGTVDTDDPYDASFGGYYEPVSFAGAEGQLVSMRMRSAADTRLYLLDPNGTVVASDRDTGFGSEIHRELQSTGTYTIIAATDDLDDTVEYELTVELPHERHLRVAGSTDVYSTIESVTPYNGTVGGTNESEALHDQVTEEKSPACSIKTTRPTTC